MIYPMGNDPNIDTRTQPATVHRVDMISNQLTLQPIVPIERLVIMKQQHLRTNWAVSQLIVTSPPDGVGR